MVDLGVPESIARKPSPRGPNTYSYRLADGGLLESVIVGLRVRNEVDLNRSHCVEGVPAVAARQRTDSGLDNNDEKLHETEALSVC